MIIGITTRGKGKTAVCICDYCGERFMRSLVHTTRHNPTNNFCSRKCGHKFHSGINNPSFGKPSHFKGMTLSEESRKKISIKMSGEKNHNWIGGRFISDKGYVYILKKDHPNANRYGYIRENRYVMEKFLGRYLTSNEVVHHIDGNKLNNEISNLELLTPSQHTTLHNLQDSVVV